MIVKITSAAQFDQHLEDNKDKLVVVDFTATWCPPCRRIGPVFAELSDNEENKNVIFLTVDVDEVSDLAVKYNITAMPTFLFLKNGQTESIVGANEPKLKQKIIELRT